MSGGVKARLKQEVSDSMAAWLRSPVSAHRPFRQQLQSYAAHVESHVHAQIDALQNGTTYTADSKPHAPDAHFPVFGVECDAHMGCLHREAVITALDKLPDAFCAVCLKVYVASVLHNLNTGQNYQPVQGSPVLTPRLAAAQSLAQAARQLAPYMFDTVSDTTLVDRMTVLPIAAATVKAHKPTAAMRYLACSQNNGLTDAAQWCTRLLDAIEPALVDAWTAMARTVPTSVLQRIGIDTDDMRPWLIKNSKAVVRMVTRFSQSGMSLEDYNLGGGFRAMDVEQLYVKIHLDDLETKLHGCLTKAWHTLHGDAQTEGWLMVFKNKHVPYEFFPGGESEFRGMHGHSDDPNRRQGCFNRHMGKLPCFVLSLFRLPVTSFH